MKENIKEKAAYFFICKKDGFTKEQEIEFHLWINENIEHKKAYESVQRVQQLFSSLSKDTKERISRKVHQEIREEKLLKKRQMFKIAASILLIITISFFGVEYLNFGIKHTYSTNKDKKNIVLPDGSTVLLDAKTTLDIKYFDDKREVNLSSGKALFNVAKNLNKPFIVNANMIKVEVLGTNFEVKNEEDRIVVDVISGKVKVEQNIGNTLKQLAILTQGKHLSFDKQSSFIVLKDIDIRNIASWKDGILFFQDNSLKSAINEFKRYHDINIFIDKSVQNYTISGSFKIDEFDKFLFALSKIYSLKVDKRDNFIRIYTKI